MINKKKISIFLSIFYLSYNLSFANDCESMENAFEKYQCRSEQVCKNYDDNKKVYNPEKYKEAEKYKDFEMSDVLLVGQTQQKPIIKAISVYKENMNNIYKCALLGVQKNSLLTIEQKLLKYDKTGDLQKAMSPKINDLVSKIDMIAKSTKCLSINKKTMLNKLSILRQTTYLTCDYNFYIEYLKEYYSDLGNALGIDKTKIDQMTPEQATMTNTVAANTILGINNSLNKEINQAYKVFPIAFHAYSEYENNYPIHFLLEVIKEDYMAFRNKLNGVLNPINQVVYKIINAMVKK